VGTNSGYGNARLASDLRAVLFSDVYRACARLVRRFVRKMMITDRAIDKAGPDRSHSPLRWSAAARLPINQIFVVGNGLEHAAFRRPLGGLPGSGGLDHRTRSHADWPGFSNHGADRLHALVFAPARISRQWRNPPPRISGGFLGCGTMLPMMQGRFMRDSGGPLTHGFFYFLGGGARHACFKFS